MRPGLLRVLHSLEDTMPATVHDGHLDLLACNAAATDLFGPLPDSNQCRIRRPLEARRGRSPAIRRQTRRSPSRRCASRPFALLRVPGAAAPRPLVNATTALPESAVRRVGGPGRRRVRSASQQ
ncbi:hypothetical protein ACIQM4_28500 [Streptomyces sp. NPDC091272]|uniref:MmyB family transcriptional regulator n=1 Tax=Streptomyces sp. NPDC091272 TaxID=3365981 RepID=UPI0038282DD1